MASKLEHIKAQKAKLNEKIDALEKEEARVASAERTACKKADDRVKMLIGILTAGLIEKRMVLIDWLSDASQNLSKSDREFLQKAKLWSELGLRQPTVVKTVEKLPA